MENIRIVLIFVVILLISGMMLLSYKADGYEKIERINQYVLYEKEVEECVDQEYDSYTVICENKYLLRNGLATSELVEGLNTSVITFEEIEEYIEYQENE